MAIYYSELYAGNTIFCDTLSHLVEPKLDGFAKSLGARFSSR